MPKTADDFNKRRLRSSNITVVVSIALVLFLLGLFGMILINAQKYSDYLKQQLVVNAYFDENYDAKDSAATAQREMEAFEKIKSLSSVHAAHYITRDQAAAEAKKDMGVDSYALFDKSIFPSSVEVSLKPQYIAPENIDKALAEIKSVPGIVDVRNNSNSQQIYQSLNKILKWLLGLSLLFLILAIVLINNSIRLKIFSKRFIIKTMQLVGARRSFILRPFIKEAAVLGVLGAFLALVVLSALWYYFTTAIHTPFVQEPNQYLLLILGVILVGIIMTVLSTVFATWRFLRSHTDDLYYS